MQEMNVALCHVPPNPLEKPLEKPLPLKLARLCAAGRDYHRSTVEGSGMRLASDAIAPLPAVELSSVSLAVCGDQTSGLPGIRGIWV